LAGTDLELDTTKSQNHSEIKRQPEQWQLLGMANVRNVLEMCQCSQTLCATQNESCAQNKHVTAVGYISDMEEIIKPF
jgi:hypothetical protein